MHGSVVGFFAYGALQTREIAGRDVLEVGVLVVTTRSPGFHYHHPPDRWRYTQAAFAEILARLDLEPVVLADDPEYPGVFVKARKPVGWRAPAATDPLAGVGGVTPMREPLKLLGRPVQPDGCGYYRFWQPWAQLARASGHLAVIPPPGQHGYLPDDDQIAEFDLVAQQRPAGRAGVLLWRRWKALGGPKLVYETDDDLL